MFSAEPLPSPEELRVVGVERDLPLAPDVIYSQDAEAALLLGRSLPADAAALRDARRPRGRLAAAAARGRGGARGRVRRPHRRARSGRRAAAAARPPAPSGRPRPASPRAAELPERPAKARVQLDGVSDYRRGVVQRVLADARIELDDDAELVLGRGAAVVEALAEGRAAYVYGDDGGDGWVTPERYELLEADGFSGRAEPTARPPSSGCAPSSTTTTRRSGPAGRELAQAHDARAHAQELVAAFDEVKPRRDPVDAPLRELARLVRVEAATARRNARRPRAGGRERAHPGDGARARAGRGARAQRAAHARGRGATPPGRRGRCPARSSGWSVRRAVASARAARAAKVPHPRDDRFAARPDGGCETYGRTQALRPSSSLSTSMAADRKLLAAAFAAIAFLTAGPARGAVTRPTQTAPAAGAVVQFLPVVRVDAGRGRRQVRVPDQRRRRHELAGARQPARTTSSRATRARR